MSPLQLVCVAVLLVGATFATVVVHSPCEEVSQDWCSIDQVSIDPCNHPKSCRMKKNSTAHLSFKFTPSFSTSNLTAGLFWVSDRGDVQFPEFVNTDGCQLTSCPTHSRHSQELDYSVWLNKTLPEGTFVFQWKLWNGDNETQVCCFKAKVSLRK